MKKIIQKLASKVTERQFIIISAVWTWFIAEGVITLIALGAMALSSYWFGHLGSKINFGIAMLYVLFTVILTRDVYMVTKVSMLYIDMRQEADKKNSSYISHHV